MTKDSSVLPLVSCIMPTYNRREFVSRAIEFFLRQDYPEKELIILDDGEDSVADLIPNHSSVRYFQDTIRKNLGAKRNWLCEQTLGEIIVHWDDDDWSAVNRLSLQAKVIGRREVDICGLNRIFFLAADTLAAWEYVYAGDGARWLYGSSFCYTKDFWQRNRFSEINIGEDNCFVSAAQLARIAVMADNTFLVALIHAGNTSPKRVSDPAWEVRNPEQIRYLMGNDWTCYRGETSEQRNAADMRQTEEQWALPTIFNMEESVKITIGIHVMDHGERLLASCAAIRVSTSIPVEVLLLADGADESAESAVAQLGEFRRVGFASRRGAPACFNLLAREGCGDILVFLENGALPGPGWLESLCRALSQNPSNGLAGPSTNRSWNMQCVFPNADADDIGVTARLAQSQFANSVRTMEPLYCLADFCYAVRREVIQTIGAADEAYGEGPCWEMDYSVRAARAGWRPVWAESAYVYRMPITPQRIQHEEASFQANRRRYQDKFCARRLRGNSERYNEHCRGDQCSNFARPEQIVISIPLDQAVPENPTSVDIVPAANLKPTAHSVSSSGPLVSCIMPTRNRRPFIHLALQCFEAQDYLSKELIIVDDGEDSIEDLVRGHPHVRYERLRVRHSIGAKRNLACELAEGKVVVLWDDDDWYGSNRISAQIDPILSGDAEITGLDTRWLLNLNTKEFWTLSAPLHQRMFVGNIAGGTMAFDRDVWDRGVRFLSMDLAEDAYFLLEAQRTGARLIPVSNDNLFIYMRHGSNSWRFTTGIFLETQGWLSTQPPNGFDNYLMDLYEEAAMKRSCT